MKTNITTLLLLAMALLVTACGDDEDTTTPDVTPTTTGTFTDPRDNYEYHWVRIGGLDWMTENSHYDLGNENKCKFYITYEADQARDYTDHTSKKYGFLYTLEGAKEAAPEGWRVPTDADWQTLEQALGMSEAQAEAREWRGTTQADLMRQKDTGTMLGLQMAGYFTEHTIMGTSGYRFMASYGFFWTQTKDPDKDGEYYFYRKLAYNSGRVYRQSMETTAQMLSVRFVRDAQ